MRDKTEGKEKRQREREEKKKKQRRVPVLRRPAPTTTINSSCLNSFRIFGVSLAECFQLLEGAICGATTTGDDCLPARSVLSLQQSVYGTYREDPNVPVPAPLPAISPASGDDMQISGSSSSASAVVSNGISGLQSVLMGSKYMKAAQQLLDEVASVREDFKTDSNDESKGQLKGSKDSPMAEASNGGEINGKWAAVLSTAERQELQMKKAKLISMLDKV
ncbi:hypothetical protein MRB53_030599 [Persea americana]|uniref:Uncharacterized protein n=1 Tax=Persea americana TaxID=3435 RepID=A0ACC2KLQ3_PERAE|nr:hypothetical protein MRB53_030599 [Persea americana]